MYVFVPCVEGPTCAHALSHVAFCLSRIEQTGSKTVRHASNLYWGHRISFGSEGKATVLMLIEQRLLSPAQNRPFVRRCKMIQSSESVSVHLANIAMNLCLIGCG